MKTSTLVDTNILIDVLVPSSDRNDWSARYLLICLESGPLVVNPIVWSEVAFTVGKEQALERALDWLRPQREHVPWSAAFAAGLAHVRYRQAGGGRERTLPDFLIGAHAELTGHAILTRDPARYRAYFPSLQIIAPDTHP